MRNRARILSSRYRLDTSFIVDYLRMPEMSFYGKYINMWIHEDLLWKEDVPKDVESVIHRELKEKRR